MSLNFFFFFFIEISSILLPIEICSWIFLIRLFLGFNVIGLSFFFFFFQFKRKLV